MPPILEITKENRDTGFDISSRTVPFFISRLIVRAEHRTAANSPNSMVVAIELSQTRRICWRNTNIEKYGNSPIMISAASSIR